MRFLCVGLLAATAAMASGGKNQGGGAATGVVEVRTFDETAPAGGTVQMKLMFTQPHPISSGAAMFSLSEMTVDGVALSSPSGTAAATALVQNGSLYLSLISPNSDLGTQLDYPFLTVTMDVPKSVSAGTSIPLGPSSLSCDSPTGPIVFADPKPGTLSIRGKLSISGLWPGGGTWPANTVLSLRGTGFQPGSRVNTKMKTGSPVFVSDTEIRLTLERSATLDQQPITVINPDKSEVTYYSYMRGVLIQKPSREILQRVEPAFASQTQAVVTVGPLATMGAGQFTAVAIQNPNPGPVSVSFRSALTGSFGTVVLPSGGRVMDELSKLVGVDSIASGDSVIISATAGVQILGITADENAGTVTPFLPSL